MFFEWSFGSSHDFCTTAGLFGVAGHGFLLAHDTHASKFFTAPLQQAAY